MFPGTPFSALSQSAPASEESDPSLIVRIGTVSSVDLAGGTAVVDLGDIQTAPLRWSTGRAGATRIWSPPTVGEQVIIASPDGDIAGAVIIGAIVQNDFPPAGDSLRELITFEDGAVIAYDPETHALDAILPADATITITATGGVTIDATDGGVTITGDITVTGSITATGDVLADGISLTGHKHGGVQSGSSETGEPS